MKTLAERKADYEKVSKKIEELGIEGLAEMLKDATQVHSGIGGTAVKLEIDGVPVFAKQIAISDLEMENPESTANLFNLPTYYQYGVGSAGFGVWRELEAHKMTTNWVLKDECPNFPLMYGHALLPREKSEPMKEETLDEITRYWGGSEQVKERLKGIDDASNSVIVFLEAVGRSSGLNPRLDYYIHPQASDGDTTKPDMEMVERELKSTCDFMESKGIIHFDAHHGNILTDGDRLYFADFGLATSLDFNLSVEEREFFEKNRGYDRSLATAGLSCHPRAESTREELPILPEVRKVSDRYQAASDRYRAFTKSLKEDFTKTTPYPAEEMRQAFQQQFGQKEREAPKKQNPFLTTILDPDYPYSKQVGNILANAKDAQGQAFFSEELRAKAGKLTNEEADKLLPEIIEMLYRENPDSKPKRMIDQRSGNGTKAEFFTKIYGDLTSKKCSAQIDQTNIKTIEQFTPKGLDTAVEYYNQKYPARGEIHRTQLLMDNLSNRQNYIETACADLLPLKQKGGSHKILLSIARHNPQDPSEISLDHSIPFVLTGDKLILMRDEHDNFGQPLFEDIAKQLGVTLVQSSAPIYDKADPKRTSIQGDHASCHFIALGVLKDLTTEDLQTVSTFNNGFHHLPKSLKYSQSATHTRNVLDEKSAREPVKKDGRTAEEYARQHKRVTEDGVTTRVTDKFNKFKRDLSEVAKGAGEEATPQMVAAVVLIKNELRGEQQPAHQRATKEPSFVEAMQAEKYGKMKNSSGAKEL